MLNVQPRVRLVLKLARQKPAVRGGELARLDDHTASFVSRVGEHHLGTKETHQLPPLNRERLRHHAYKRMALDGAHHRKADASVATRGLDDGLARLELAMGKRPLDHPERKPVLDAARGIGSLHLYVHVDTFWRHALYLNERRAANGSEDRVMTQRGRRVSRIRRVVASGSRIVALGGCATHVDEQPM